MADSFIKKLLKDRKKKNNLDLDFYQKVDLFKNLTNKEIMILSDLFIDKYYEKNEIIYRESHPQVVIYIVKSGKVTLQIDLPHLKFKIFEIYAGKHFGEIGMFLESSRIHTATAEEDTELIAIKKSDLKQFILDNPASGIKLLYNLGKFVAEKLIDTSKLIRQNGIFE